jgi:hypothetical protein
MDRFEILKAAKRKKGLVVRDFWYFDLETMVHEGLLNKTFPKKGYAPGWPVYTITRKGLRSLDTALEEIGD